MDHRGALEYRLGYRELPEDVCRPKTRVIESTGPLSPKILIHGNKSSSCPIPRRVESGLEATRPIMGEGTCGPGHDQIQSLAEGRCGPVTLAGRYRLERCIGRGGMASVFAGELISIGRPVALKILHDAPGHDNDGLQRFLREARIMARIRHRHVVEVLDLGSTKEGVVYMVMELLEGEDLHKLMSREQRLPWASARPLMLQICDGLDAVHRAGIVHRDLKPANCFTTAEGIKLLDFGIAAALDGRTSVSGPDTRRFTAPGHVIGTPEYMSPEQARGGGVDVRGDIYAAGVLLGEMLTGRVPFDGKSATVVIEAQIYKPPPSLSELAAGGVEVDPDVEAIYLRALSKDPADRFPTVAALREALLAVGTDKVQPRWRCRPRRMVSAAGLIATNLRDYITKT